MAVPLNPSGQAVLKFLPIDPDKGNYNQAVDTITMISQAFGSNGSGLLDNVVSTSTDLYIGSNAGAKITTGTTNTFVGAGAGASTTTSASNVGVGYQALNKLTTGVGFNTAVGYLALATAAGTNAITNTAVGYQALTGLTTGSYNTALGVNTGIVATTGTNNLFLGYAAGRWEAGSNVILIDTQLRPTDQATARAAAPIFATTDLNTPLGSSQTIQFNCGAMGFFGTTAVAKQTATAYATIVANSGTAMLAGSTSTGGSGSTAYTFGDVVLALKNYGFLVV